MSAAIANRFSRMLLRRFAKLRDLNSQGLPGAEAGQPLLNRGHLPDFVRSARGPHVLLLGFATSSRPCTSYTSIIALVFSHAIRRRGGPAP